MYLTINGECYAKGNVLIFSPGQEDLAFEIDHPESVVFLRRLLPLCTGTIAIGHILQEMEMEHEPFMEAIEGLIELNVVSILEKPHDKVAIVSPQVPHKDLLRLTESQMLQEFCILSELSDVDSSFTMIVAIDYDGNHLFFQEVHEKSINLTIPWMKVSIQDLSLQIGPVFFPDGGPCYYCYAERTSLNQPEESRLVQIGNFGRTESLIAPFLEREILKYIRHTGPSRLFERELIINTYKMEISSYRVLQMPGCSACAR